MRLINLSNSAEVLNLADVLARFPEKIFPAEASLIDLDDLGFAIVDEGTVPGVNESEQRVSPGAVELQDHRWVQTYVVTDLPPEEIEQARQELRVQQYQHGKAVVELLLNQKAQERDYDTIQAAVIRSAYPGPYRQEGAAYGVWMDSCWQAFYALTSDTQLPFPTDQQILDALPLLELPAAPVL
jgi:hypothetical protein